MSDVTVAPSAAPPPSNNEAVVNENPTSTPQPIGSQAPDKPAGEQRSETRPASRREAIQKAFDRANTPERREATKPAQARPGHNNPPEETPKEKPKRQAQPEDLDLHKRPAAQRERGEHGHFVARSPEGEEYRTGQQQQNARNQAEAQRATQQRAQLPIDAPHRTAPQRMSERARQDWNTTPESVRAEVSRMHHEFDQGFKRYKNDHESMKAIRPFEVMAQQHGTTLERALTNYVSMEDKLRKDVVGGLDLIVNNLNLRTPDGRKLNLRDIAFHILNQSPEQHQLVQAQNAQTAQHHQIGQLHQMVNTLAQGIQQMQYERKFTDTRSALDRYADDGNHPRFDELADLIEQEIKAGYDVESAYRRADLLRPARQAAQTRNGTQARAADRSISGAPDAGPSNGTSRPRRDGKPVGRRDAIANAIKRVNGSL